MGNIEKLVADLREANLGLAYNSIQNGCVDCGLACSLADKAADTIESLQSRVKCLEEALDDAQCALLAVRATAGSAEWAESAPHFFALCGETVARTTLSQQGGEE